VRTAASDRLAGAWTRAVEPVRDLARRTPPDRDRVVDAARAGSIVVVVLWHWALSITHRDPDGVLANPNPIAEVPLGWAPTWVLQVMPVFFVVGGFANLTRWRSTLERGDGAGAFLRDRAERLLPPFVAFVAVWAAVDGAARLLDDEHRSVLETARITFLPLWFLGAYLWVVALTPLTGALHRRTPRSAVVGLAVVVAGVDVARFGFDVEAARWVNTALVWVLVHQLGYWWADGTLPRWPIRRAVALAAAGLAGLAALTSLDVYPRSMVATSETDISHMYPPTAVLAILAATQLGLLVAARPWLGRWLRRRRPWMAVVAVNSVVLTVFLWHTTALLVVILTIEALGGSLGDEPTVGWWLTRPLWVLGPALALAPLVAAFGPLETRRRASG
jgi:fucose 4-O-acetylase-like acetyltransferase